VIRTCLAECSVDRKTHGGCTVKNAKKLMFAALAALMIAGSLSAVSGATSISSFGPVAVIGEGPSPMPVVLSSVPDNDTTSFGQHF
jgi:hypothetical protein